MDWWRRLRAAWMTKPTAVTLPVVMIFTGLTALILGEASSKAFTNLGGATLIRVMGAAMLLGGSLIVAGIVRADPALEPMGLTLAALGASIYGAGVIIGLGVGGLIAGQLALGIAVGFLGRIWLLLRAGRLVAGHGS